jgi:hypothetical protein
VPFSLVLPLPSPWIWSPLAWEVLSPWAAHLAPNGVLQVSLAPQILQRPSPEISMEREGRGYLESVENPPTGTQVSNFQNIDNSHIPSSFPEGFLLVCSLINFMGNFFLFFSYRGVEQK